MRSLIVLFPYLIPAIVWHDNGPAIQHDQTPRTMLRV